MMQWLAREWINTSQTLESLPAVQQQEEAARDRINEQACEEL